LESTFISSLAQQSNKLDNLSDLTPKDEDPVQQNEYENSQELKAKVDKLLNTNLEPVKRRYSNSPKIEHTQIVSKGSRKDSRKVQLFHEQANENGFEFYSVDPTLGLQSEVSHTNKPHRDINYQNKTASEIAKIKGHLEIVVDLIGTMSLVFPT
jgi:hypothetical protein